MGGKGKMRRRGNISRRCMVCIMSAMMMMSSVTGTMITPIGAYATPYATTTEVPEDTDGHRNLASEDTLDVNDGTIHENRGTIRENNGTVEDNNSGTVVSNSGTVNWGNVTTNESSGTVVAATVTDNYGTATEDSIVTNNYALAVNSTVTNNWASGTVSGTSLVTNNHGGRIDGDGVTVSNTLESDPGPNPPVQEVKPINNPTDIISEVQPDTPKPEENNDQPQAPAPTNIVDVKGIENAITAQLNNMPADSTNGEIMIEFGTNTNIDADMLYSLLTYTPEGRTSVNEPIFCSFKIDGVTYYLRIDRGTQISAEQIKAFFTNNKSEGPMQIAQWFGNYGVSLVPSYDAILKLLEPELSFMNGSTLEKIGFSEFNTKEDVDTRFNKILNRCKDEMKIRIEDHKDDDIANLSEEDLETYYSQIFGDLKDGDIYKEVFDAEIELAKAAEQKYFELWEKNRIKANYLDNLLGKAEESGPSCLTSDMKSLKKAGDAINKFRGRESLDRKVEDFYSSVDLEEWYFKSKKKDINNELEKARKQLYELQQGNSKSQPLTEDLALQTDQSQPSTEDSALQSDQPQTTAITNANAETAVSAEKSAAKAETTAITNANAAIAPVNNAASGSKVKGDHSGALGD